MMEPTAISSSAEYVAFWTGLKTEAHWFGLAMIALLAVADALLYLIWRAMK